MIKIAKCKLPLILDRFLMKLEYFQQCFEKYSKIKLHENLSNGSMLFLTDRQTYMTKLIVIFHNFARVVPPPLPLLTSFMSDCLYNRFCGPTKLYDMYVCMYQTADIVQHICGCEDFVILCMVLPYLLPCSKHKHNYSLIYVNIIHTLSEAAPPR
jgi:hypothetical protein